MGWAFCGTDREGREIGYGVRARCDHPGCKKWIDRGLSYACGGWHGIYAAGDETYECCERYFCEKHRFFCLPWGEAGDGLMLCAECKVEADRLYEEAEAAALLSDGAPMRHANPNENNDMNKEPNPHE